MKAMESSMEEEECIVETVTPTRKKKMKQGTAWFSFFFYCSYTHNRFYSDSLLSFLLAQLPFPMLSSLKSSSDTGHDTRQTKKKRKLASPLVEAAKKSKVMKLSTKENSARSNSKGKRGEINPDDVNKLNVPEVMKEEGEKDKGQSVQQTHESKKEHITPKKRFSLRKQRKDQQKSGALTKFIVVSNNKEAERGAESPSDHSSCQNPSSDAIVLSSDNEASSEADKSTLDAESKEANNDELASVATSSLRDKKKKKVKNLSPIKLDLSSDNEASVELETSTLSTSGKVTNESTSAVTPTSDRKKGKVKPLTPKQLQKEQEIARKRKEKLKLREVRNYKLRREEFELLLYLQYITII